MTTASETTPTLHPGTWTLDTAHSSVGFAIRHLGIAKVRGRFSRFDTEFVVDDSGAATLGATIHLDSFDTGNSHRDEHMRAADFLDVANRPTLTFRADAPVRIADTFTVTGQATMGNTSAPVTLAVTWGGTADFAPANERHTGFSATGTIKRSDFGVGGSMPGVLSDTVTIELDIQLVEPK